MSFKHILVTGSASESYVRLLLEKVFQVNNYTSKIKEYRLGGLKIIVSMNLNSNLVNFSETCERISKNLTSIIFIENSESPSTLQRDLNLLLTFFNAFELKIYLKIFFVYQNLKEDRLHQLRLNMLTNDILFNDFLQISDRNLKWKFITQNIWILHENYMQQLRDQFRQSNHFQENSHKLDAKKIVKIGAAVIFIIVVIKIMTKELHK